MKKIVTLSFALFFIIGVFAQKKTLTIDDFTGWNKIEKRQISRNGKFVCYELNKQKGDGKLIVYNAIKKTNDTILYGYSARFSPYSDFIAFKIKPQADTVRKAKLAEVKKDKLPKDSMAVFILSTKELIKYPKVKSFKMPKENSSWLAFLLEHKQAVEDTAYTDTSKTKLDIKKTAAKKGKDKKNNDLIILNPLTHKQFTFNRVTEYTVSKKGINIALLSKVYDTIDIFAVIIINPEIGSIDTLIQDSITFKKLTLDESGKHLAFLVSKDTIDDKVFTLQFTHLNKPEIKTIVDTLTPEMFNGWAPSINGKVYFSDDGLKLFFGTAKKPVCQPKDTVLDDEKPKVDVWSWTDIDLQPMQLLNLDKEKKRTYKAVYHIKNEKFVQLADTIVRNIKLLNKNNGNWALGLNDKDYRRSTSWNGKWLNDYYLINVKTGHKKLLLKGKSRAYLSPTGKYIVWYELTDSSYYATNCETGKSISLTKSLPVIFCNELNDKPTNPYPYGIAGWAENDATVFIYDRFDIWKFDLKDKNKPENITNHYGRKNKISLRYRKLDKELVYMPNKIIIEAFNEESFKAGYFSAFLTSRQNPVKLYYNDVYIGSLQKADDADSVIWSTQTVSEYPEIKISSLSFKKIETISNTNPQQIGFNWATNEIVEWESFAGDSLKGVLYKPENFDASKKYPMIVYFYERSSQYKNAHSIPSPSRSIINKTFYASNGYLVFVPDIVYTNGYPGQSAYNAIVSGVNYLKNSFNYVNSEKIALQGQSWGGYQIAYLVTQTNMFAAAMAGAPVSNMTSAYGGIRWGSGMSRMFQYEHSQSRIGGTLWEKPLLYIENSPVFYAPKVNTPLLIMHNDNDGAVPWYQGIEYFVALRRLNKPVWMLNYNGMKHNIESKYWANRIDLSKRMFQFFNHYLKDEPAPKWMIDGVSAIDKGIKLGY